MKINIYVKKNSYFVFIIHQVNRHVWCLKNNHKYNQVTGFGLSISQSRNAIYFSHYRDSKQVSFLYFRDTKLYAKYKKTCEFRLYCWDHVCWVNDWCLIDCFHREFRVSTQIMVRDYCIVKAGSTKKVFLKYFVHRF